MAIMTMSKVKDSPVELTPESLTILFEDRHLIAVNKPARIPVASEAHGDLTLLEVVRSWNAARQAEGKKGYCVPIHFLDRPVSGVILFGLSSKGAARLNEQFRSRSLAKTYVAITEHIPREPKAKLEHWLAKNRDSNVTKVVGPKEPDAKRSELSYRVLATCQGRALVEVKPVTGRSHQIRAQMAAIGCPLLGDLKYGSTVGWDGKVALHAAKLEIKHPVGGELLRLTAPVPSYWQSSTIWPCLWPDLERWLLEEGISFDGTQKQT